MSIPAFELGWVVGFLEGEGCFRVESSRRHGVTITISANQVEPEPLERLLRYAGVGKLSAIRVRRTLPNASPIGEWRAHGQGAADLAKQIRPLMSPKRQRQIDTMLRPYESRRTWAQYSASRKAACKRGHPRTPENIYPRAGNHGFDCLVCRRANKKARHVQLKIVSAGGV